MMVGAGQSVRKIVGGTLAPDARFDLRPPEFPRVFVERGVPIRVSDGVVLSADITYPADADGNAVRTPMPVVVSLWPYHKTMITRLGKLIDVAGKAGPWLHRRVAPSPHGRFGAREFARLLGGGVLDSVHASRTLAARGYVHLAVDIRGTGASTGRFLMMGEREQQDHLEVLAWARSQSWSNGDLALTGMSYLAIAALLTAGRRPEGLKAVFAFVPGADPGRDLQLNGGMQSIFFPAWLVNNTVMRLFPSVPSLVRNRVLGRFVWDRITDPLPLWSQVVRSFTSDDYEENFVSDRMTVMRPDLENITAATWVHSAWHDVFAPSATQIFNRLQLEGGAKQLCVEDSYHGFAGSGFGTAGNPQRLDELQCAFFDRWVKDVDNGIDGYGPITVRQQGGDWESRGEFPHSDATVHSWHLTNDASGSAGHAAYDGSLSSLPISLRHNVALPRERPSARSQTTSVALCGIPNVLSKEWAADDRRYESRAVTFSTAPLDRDLLISGPANLSLRVRTTGTDAFWVVTVCDVAPTGESSVIARGALRSSRRAIDELSSVRVGGELVAADHPFTRDVVLPVVPGEVHDLDISINPTEAVLRAGHRLRLTVTKSSWPRYIFGPMVARRMGHQEIVLDPEYPSRLTLLAVKPTLI